MNRYLENIIARTLGSAPVVEPRLTSVFEPFARGEGLNDSFSDEAGARPEKNRSRGTEPPVENHGPENPNLPLRDSMHEPTHSRNLRRSSAADPSSRQVNHFKGGLFTIDDGGVRASVVIREEAKENRASDSDSRPGSKRFDQVDGLQRMTAPTMDERLPASGIVVKSDALRFHSGRDQDAAVGAIPSAGKPLQPRVLEEQKPMIRITIGRVDVRAMTTAQPLSRPVRTESKHFLTLNEYLKRRDGGGR